MLFAPVLLALVVIGVVLLVRRRRGEDALPAAVVLRRAGFGIVVAWTFLGGAFIAGETVADPGGLAAVGLIGAWLVPLVGLGLLARLNPDLAVQVLRGCVGVVLAVSLWYAAAPDAWRDFEDDHGPVRAIATFALAAVLGLLGLWRTREAGLLLLVLGLGPVLLAEVGGGRGMPSLIAAATMPVVVGALYLASAAVGRRHPVGYGPTER
jgi:hypothetical protein